MKISRKNISTILSIVIILFCLSCNKDKVKLDDCYIEIEDICDGCEPIPEIEGVNFGYTHVHDTIIQQWGQFNPNNDNEILYVESNQNFGNRRLIIYNLVTEQKTVIYEGSIIDAPAWSKTGWILLNLMDFQIWKVKPDGDSLTQVTSNSSWFHPEVNLTGDKFLVYRGYVSPTVSVVMDLDGNGIDTIPGYFSGGDWKHTSLYGNVDLNQVKIYDMNDLEITSQYTWNDVNQSIDDFCWVSGSEGIISNSSGLYRINPFSGTTSKLFCTCNSRSYYWSCTNSNKSKVIYTRIESTPIGNNTLVEDHTLFMMSPDGLEHEILNLD